MVTSLPCDTSPEIGPRRQVHGGRELGQEVVGQIEIEIEAGQVPGFLFLDFVDVKLGEQHAAFGMIGVRQAAGSPWGKGPSP